MHFITISIIEDLATSIAIEANKETFVATASTRAIGEYLMELFWLPLLVQANHFIGFPYVPSLLLMKSLGGITLPHNILHSSSLYSKCIETSLS